MIIPANISTLEDRQDDAISTTIENSAVLDFQWNAKSQNK